MIEYHPQGFFEKTGNIWRAQGRRIRLELKHFRRQVMIQTLLHPDDVEGWHGEIRDGEVVPEEDLDEEPEDEDTEGDEGDEGDEEEPDEYDEVDEEPDENEDEEPEDAETDDGERAEAGSRKE